MNKEHFGALKTHCRCLTRERTIEKVMVKRLHIVGIREKTQKAMANWPSTVHSGIECEIKSRGSDTPFFYSLSPLIFRIPGQLP